MSLEFQNQISIQPLDSEGGGGGGGTTPSVGVPREVTAQGVFQMPSTSITYSFPNGTTTIAPNSMSYAFYKCTGLTGIDFTGVTTISNDALYQCCNGCTNITSVSFPNVTTIGYLGCNNTFRGCTGITSVSFPELTTIDRRGLYYTFYSCTGITTATFPKLTSIPYEEVFDYTFGDNNNITDIYFPALTTTSFGSYTNQFANIINSTATTKFHFPSNLASVTFLYNSSTSSATRADKFGSSVCSILFDLPATT